MTIRREKISVLELTLVRKKNLFHTNSAGKTHESLPISNILKCFRIKLEYMLTIYLFF